MNTFSNRILNGNILTLIRISFPLMFFLLFEVLSIFCERVFLANFSINALHGSLNAENLVRIFQAPCIAIGVVAQVFVGLYYGKGENESIGPCIWQFIWFSLLSYIIILPLSFLVSSLYFKDLIIQKPGTDYFGILILGNGLFPLSAALSSFFLGRGKTSLVTGLMLTSYVLHVGLSYVLISGIEGIIPAMEVKGAALSRCLCLGIVCIVLFSCFLSRKNRSIYKSKDCRFFIEKLWHYIRPGMVRAFCYLVSAMNWSVITYLMIKKGGDYLNVVTVGGTIISFLFFIGKGIYQTNLTIASYLVGQGKAYEIWNLSRSFMLFISILFMILIIPMIFFPESLMYFFDPSSKQIFKQTFMQINFWIWLYLFSFTMQISFTGLIVALHEMKCQLFCSFFLWPITLMPIFFGLYLNNWQADKLWLIVIFENIVMMAIMIFRLKKMKLNKNPFIRNVAQVKYPHLKSISGEEH